MPWIGANVSSSRTRFAIRADAGSECFTTLCKSFGISRHTGYRWLRRYRKLGESKGLNDMSRRPHHSPNKTTTDIEYVVLALHDRSGWGARRISVSLKKENIQLAASTVHRILRRYGRPEQRERPSANWMIDILLADKPLSLLERELPASGELSSLANLVRTGRMRERKKAMSIIACLKGTPATIVAKALNVHCRTVRRDFNRYNTAGHAALLSRRKPRYSDLEGDKQLLFALLHSPPSAHGINRTSWKMDDLHRILGATSHRMSHKRIRKLIKATGFRWRKARVVLTSKDPDYGSKVAAIKAILSELRGNEAFFSIDEFGPFAVKRIGGLKRVSPDENYQVPQWQKSKGWMIITAALDLEKNQVIHFYSLKKNTDEMIKMADLLRIQYRGFRTIYLSWDAASWHVSKKLFAHLEEMNQHATRDGFAVFKTVPLPAGSQFLNVIESVFSGMARAIIHNSDYSSVENAKSAIDRYFEERNDHFLKCPKRAGHKIWGLKRVPSEFSEGHNCKDPRY